MLHLLYARFWHKVLYDIGVVPTKEPFQKLVNQGMILGTNNEKMSKSRGNVINPDDIVEQVRRGYAPHVRDVHGTAGGDEAVEHERRGRNLPLPEPGMATVHRRRRAAEPEDYDDEQADDVLHARVAQDDQESNGGL